MVQLRGAGQWDQRPAEARSAFQLDIHEAGAGADGRARTAARSSSETPSAGRNAAIKGIGREKMVSTSATLSRAPSSRISAKSDRRPSRARTKAAWSAHAG